MPVQRVVLSFALALLALLVAYAIVARWPDTAPATPPGLFGPPQ